MSGDIARVDMRYGPDPNSSAARAIVGQVRDVAPPAGARAYVGGPSAQLVDELSSLGRTLPWMALVVALATFVLLFLAFGSVVLPVKAIVMNVLSLSAMYGVVVWIFQEGHLSGLLNFTPTGTIDPTMPILMFAIMFGLSMDYEVFLLSRIRERYDITGDNTAAVAGGLQRTGGLITSLALLLVIVVGAFSASGITFIKLLGVGMIVALILDAIGGAGAAGARGDAAARARELVGAEAAAPAVRAVRHPREPTRPRRVPHPPRSSHPHQPHPDLPALSCVVGHLDTRGRVKMSNHDGRAGRRVGRGRGQAAERRDSSASVSSRPGAWAESVIDSGRLAPGMGITTGARASIQASVTRCGDTPCASATSWNAACRAPSPPARPMPPSGLQGRNAMPSSAQ